jgi:hypothetical protein
MSRSRVWNLASTMVTLGRAAAIVERASEASRSHRTGEHISGVVPRIAELGEGGMV